jgi:hypothetical protein
MIEFSLDGAPVAQLDRASGYEPEGREFESLRAHHSNLHRYHKLKLEHPLRFSTSFLGIAGIINGGISKPVPDFSATSRRNSTSSASME